MRTIPRWFRWALVLPIACAITCAAAAGPGASEAAAAADPAADVLRKVESRYASVRTMIASFRQVYRSPDLGQAVAEEGKLWVKRPGRMRWEYREPARKVFVLQQDGSSLSYVPADFSAVRSRLPRDAPHLRVLLGEGTLAESFDAASVTLKDPAVPGSVQLKLTPKEPMASVEIVYLEVDPSTFAVVRVLALDALGNESDLVLSRVRENVEVRDDTFQVKLPAGIEVREATAAGPGRADGGG